MASQQISSSGVGLFGGSSSNSCSIRVSSINGVRLLSTSTTTKKKKKTSFQRLVVKSDLKVNQAESGTARGLPKYSSIKPWDHRRNPWDRRKTKEEKTTGGILLPSAAQTKPQGAEVVATGEVPTLGENKVNISDKYSSIKLWERRRMLPKIKIVESKATGGEVLATGEVSSLGVKKFDISDKVGFKVLHLKHAGTEVDFNGSKHLLLKEDDIVEIIEYDDIKDLKLLNKRVFVKGIEAESKTAGGLLVTETTKDGQSVGPTMASLPPIKLSITDQIVFSLILLFGIPGYILISVAGFLIDLIRILCRQSK
ncbi:hypothetical protein GIB67_030685 [Kingdonia uniflora]|uniref:Uncharacterized protein n=1 Tax=Kingdonia uniflora TaxID=39325 RepID=A0A7J7NJ38_9MAGN|nr:hypothetical protein GIB67_030685 [Kingdonia uniflora]